MMLNAPATAMIWEGEQPLGRAVNAAPAQGDIIGAGDRGLNDRAGDGAGRRGALGLRPGHIPLKSVGTSGASVAEAQEIRSLARRMRALVQGSGRSFAHRRVPQVA